MYPKVFYSVFGMNGFGVFTDYKKVVDSRKYLTAFNCKKHKTYLDAKIHAIKSFNSLQGCRLFQIGKGFNRELPYNVILFRKDIFGGYKYGAQKDVRIPTVPFDRKEIFKYV